MIRNAFFYLVSSMLSKLSPFFLLPILANKLQPAHFGEASLSITSIAVLSLFVGLSTQAVIPKYYFSLTLERFRTLVFSMLVLIAMAFSVVIASAHMVEFVYVSSDSSVDPSLLAWASLGTTTVNIFLSYLRTTSRVFLYCALEISQSILIFLFVWISLASTQHPDATSWVNPVCFVYGVFGLLGAFGIIFMIRPIVAYDRESLAKLLGVCSALFFHSAALMVVNFADRYILKAISGAEQLAHYVLANNIALIVKVGSDAVMKSWNPFYFKNSQNLSLIKKYMRFLVGCMVLVSLLYCVVALAAFDFFFPPSYSDAKIILPILVLGYAIFFLYQINVARLMNASQEHALRVITPLAALANIALNFFLIPYCGAIGAALATVLSYAVMAILIHQRLKYSKVIL